MTLRDGLAGPVPRGFRHDRSEAEIGRGRAAFEAAREALRRWAPFDVGWARVANPDAPIAPGAVVAVEAHTACFWSLNVNRIAETADEPARFGFLYTTTAEHVEEGQERFVVELDPATNGVRFLIEAVSRPRHPLARIGYPYARAMQRRFARDAIARMRSATER